MRAIRAASSRVKKSGGAGWISRRGFRIPRRCLHNYSCLPKSTFVTLRLGQRPYEPREIPGATHSTTPSTAHRQTHTEVNLDEAQQAAPRNAPGRVHLLVPRITLCQRVRSNRGMARTVRADSDPGLREPIDVEELPGSAIRARLCPQLSTSAGHTPEMRWLRKVLGMWPCPARVSAGEASSSPGGDAGGTRQGRSRCRLQLHTPPPRESHRSGSSC